ncbi:MAG TPA: VWA domain-containing protein [Pirellulaceae bacterium]|nr:VWA domain-containing protein [Pirellulaceae bacterium]
MTLRVIDKNVGLQQKRKPVPTLKKRKRWSWKFILFLLAVLFYLGFLGFWFTRHYWFTQAEPEIETVQVVELPILTPDYPDLREDYFEKVIELGKFGCFDPRFARSEYDTAVAFAKEHKLDGHPAITELNRLPKPSTIDSRASVRALSTQLDAPVYWVELSVAEPGGRFVSGLTRIDFELTQAGNRLHLVGVSESIKNGRAPAIALLMDISGSTIGKPSLAAVAAADDFVKENTSRSRLKLWTFASQVRAETRWTANQVEIRSALQRLKPDGGTALNRAISDAIEDAGMLDMPAALVLFTDGSDSFNDTPLEPALERAKQFQIPIHVVALKTGETKEPVLRQIATETGGTYHMVDSPDGLLQEFRQVSRSLTTPVYRLAVMEPLDQKTPLTVQVGGLQPLNVRLER